MGVRGCINATILVDLLQKGVVGGSGRRISTPVKEQSSLFSACKGDGTAR